MFEIRQAAHLLVGIWGEDAADYARRRRAEESDRAAWRTWTRIVDEVERFLGDAPPPYQPPPYQ